MADRKWAHSERYATEADADANLNATANANATATDDDGRRVSTINPQTSWSV